MKSKKELEDKRYELEKKIKYTEVNTKQWYYLKGQFDFLNWLERAEYYEEDRWFEERKIEYYDSILF